MLAGLGILTEETAYLAPGTPLMLDVREGLVEWVRCTDSTRLAGFLSKAGRERDVVSCGAVIGVRLWPKFKVPSSKVGLPIYLSEEQDGPELTLKEGGTVAGVLTGYLWVMEEDVAEADVQVDCAWLRSFIQSSATPPHEIDSSPSSS